MKLRITQSQWAKFVSELCLRHDVETAGLIFAERLQGCDVLLARQLLRVPDDCYEIRKADQIRISPLSINRLVRQARDSGWSVITAHTHPEATLPWFSKADDIGDSRLMPSLYSQMPGPHGSIVIAGETGIPAGRMWLEDGTTAEVSFRIVGQALQMLPVAACRESETGWFDRQRLALGDAGQEILRRLHVAVVGLGGTGSITFAQLVHLGVGRITVIDGDKVESSNLSRILGATTQDVGVTWKVDVAKRYAAQLGFGTRVTAIRGSLGTNASTTDIEACDAVLSCVDRHAPRAILNRLAYAKAIPVIDMGSAFRVNQDGQITSSAGRVVIVGPGRRCLGCWGHIDADRIRIESLLSEERRRQAADGYVDGADVPQPSVIAFNTAIAGAAVVELMRLVTGFAGASDAPARLGFDFETGTVRRNCLAAANECTICSGNTPVTTQLAHTN
jgi:molybdopterin-synthase adenylyltransferase